MNREGYRAYYNRESIDDSCTAAAFCFFAMAAIGLVALVLDVSGLFPR